MSSDDIIQISQLVCREREGRDRQWWDEMRKAFSRDAVITISWYQGGPEGFIEGSIELAKKDTASFHRLRPVVVRVNGDRAIATLSAAIEVRTCIDGVEADLDLQSRLIYRAVREEGGWKLASLDCIYQRDTLVPAVPGEQLVIDVQELKAFRKSYRCFSYVLGKMGIPVNQDLPGDDRPEQVQALYDDAFKWLDLRQHTRGR